MCGFHGCTSGHMIGRDALAHRGPDYYGFFKDGNIILEHWRLSIIDLSSNGNQPMTLCNDTTQVIAYNGEVYNFNELKGNIKDLEFKSNTDTEVVLGLYRQFGLDFLQDLNGMFALAIYDKIKKKIVLARDRFGIKPLYYHIDEQSNLLFASELKALIFNHSINVTLDVAAIQSLFHLLYIEDERTPFNEIKKLPPGCYLLYDLETKKFEISKYHEFQFHNNNLSESQCVNIIEDLLAESVKMHLISDVSVGALLSGGVDSSLMVALMTKHSSDILTYSVGYNNHLFDESRFFNLVANKYHTKHHHKLLHGDQLDLLIDEVCSVLDEPIGDTSVFLNYFIFEFVSKSVKVCLSGLGGDELFAGYNRYLACRMLPIYYGMPKVFRQTILSIVSLFPASRYGQIGNKIRLLKTFLKNADSDFGQSYCNFIDYFSNNKQSPILNSEKFSNSRFHAYWEDEFVNEMNRIYKYDIENYMVNDLLFLTDRMSMKHSLEARVPYLENKLVDFALGISSKNKIRGFTLKYLLKKVAQRYLPSEVVFRRKQGFSAPISNFLSASVLESLRRELLDNKEEYAQILNKDLFLDIISEHQQGNNDFSLQIFTLIVYLKWMSNCYSRIRARGPLVYINKENVFQKP